MVRAAGMDACVITDHRCHNCESGLLAGAVAYSPEPVEPPADGNLLICCSQPHGDVILDL
jgi:hypothetical protein